MIKLKKNTSIYQLANWDDSLPYQTDLCTIARKALMGFLMSIMFVICVSLFLIGILSLPFTGIMYMLTGVFIATEAYMIMTALLIIIATIVALVYIYKAFSFATHEVGEISVVKEAYTGFKEKTCVLVELER